MSAIQMAEPPDPGVPHPSLQLCDLFFLAGDLDTPHSTGRGTGIKESIRALAPFSPPYISPPLMSVFWFSFQLRPSDSFCKQRGGSSVMWVHSMWVNSLQDNRCGGVCPVHIYTFLCPHSRSRNDRLWKHRKKGHKYGFVCLFLCLSTICQKKTLAGSSMKECFILNSVELGLARC